MSSTLAPVIEPTAPAVPSRIQLALGVREFARAVRHIHDLKTFLEILEVGLEKTGVCGEADLRVKPADETSHRPDSFVPGRLSLPLVAGGEIVTVASVSPPEHRQHFGAEDLQLLGGLSELIGAALDVSRRVVQDEQAIAALKAVLNFAPVGICAFDANGVVTAVNTLARGWLAIAEGDRLEGSLPAEATLDDVRQGASFHLRIGGRLLFCEARAVPDACHGALVITDLTPEQGRFLDALNREVFRANHLRRPLHFVLLERNEPKGSLLAVMSQLRGTLGQAGIVGPYDAARIGLIFPEATWSAALIQVRRIAPLLGNAEVRIGRAGLDPAAENAATAETMISAALEAPESLALLLRPRVLVHDAYRGVGDALRLVLGTDCDVTGSTDADEARRLLASEHFDAVIADADPQGASSDLVAIARARNQQVRAFYLSSTVANPASTRLGDVHVPVIPKPFRVDAVRQQILSSLRPPVSPAQK